MNVKEKIIARLVALESDLKAGKHLKSEEAKAEVESLLESAAKFYSALSDEDRDFVSAARHAIESGLPWA